MTGLASGRSGSWGVAATGWLLRSLAALVQADLAFRHHKQCRISVSRPTSLRYSAWVILSASTSSPQDGAPQELSLCRRIVTQ
jgi:hypothetical protein